MHAHWLRVKLPWSIREGWLAVWDEECVKSLVQAMVLLAHTCLHTQ
jgi:hypothetical protein